MANQIFNSETVFPAAPVAIPFLARLAAAGVQSEFLLNLLGSMARSNSEVGVPPGAARYALAAQLPTLLPLLTHGDPVVREWAVWAVAQGRAPKAALSALLSCWQVETDPSIRGDLLFGIALLEPSQGRDLAASVLRVEEPAQVRISAVAAGLDTGLAWSDEMTAAMIASLPANQMIGQTPWMMEPLVEVAERLIRKRALSDAINLVVSALRIHSEPGSDAHMEAFNAAESLGDSSRDARAPLLPALLPLLDNPEDVDDLLLILEAWRNDDDGVTPGLVHLAAHAHEDLADQARRALHSLRDAP
ncbi:hypothetical protein [Streptomyces sp. NPDC056227]|uniref:hypothetical protein n=1 Tax=Streptomyces sp. NPDC056227 TaxID=3345753 RepID=UPI0035DBBC0E